METFPSRPYYLFTRIVKELQGYSLTELVENISLILSSGENGGMEDVHDPILTRKVMRILL
jgi:hypothetical protein